MRRTMISFVFLLIGIVGHVFADDLPTDTELQELVQKLDDSSRSTRQNAELRLFKIGPPAIEQLEKLKTPQSEMGQREFKRILSQLRYRQAVLRQTMPELEFPETLLTLNESVHLFEEQTGYKLKISPDLKINSNSIRFSARKLSYWSAMTELLNHFQLDLTVDESGRVYVLSEQTQPRFYFASLESRSTDTAYRINRITRKEIAGRDDFDLFRITLQSLFVPTRHPLYLQVSGDQVLELTHSKDQRVTKSRLTPFSPDALIELPCHLQLISPEFRVDWLIPKDKHPDSLDLYLRIRTLEALDHQDFVFDDWSAPRVSQRQGLAVVTREKISLDKDNVSVLMVVLHSERGAPFESHREWMSKTKIRLSDGTQEISPSGPAEKVLEADGTTALRFTFPRPDSPIKDWKLIYQLPTHFKEFQKSVVSQIDLKIWLDQESDN
jgi:hypothetical protein